MEEVEKRCLINSIIFPFFFVLILWLIKFAELLFGTSFSDLGIFPRNLHGLKGILFYPLIHADFNHLINNSTSLLLLGIGIFYFYPSIAYKIYFLTYFMSGLWIWASARESYHIGASGLIYGFAAFIFISGIIRQNVKLLALSLLVIFLYGGMVWGIFPVERGISWEGHLWGGVAGLILAIYYRREGPQKPIYSWDIEEDQSVNDSTASR